MALLHGRASFPGVKQVVSCSYTLSHGITPGIAQLVIAPQAVLPQETGDLVITDGQTTIKLKDCKIDQSQAQRDSGGNRWSIPVFDRRWKWQFGDICGHYNLRNDKGELRTETEKSPRDLATLCFEAMGEKNFDANKLPNDPRPEVTWDWDNPAKALADLCDELACRIVYRPDTDSVEIVRIGEGALLPSGFDVMQDSNIIDPPEKPDLIILVGGKSRHEVMLVLEAVGKDVVGADGVLGPWKLIDDLSYKPAAGWKTVSPVAFPHIPGSGESARKLAKETVYRAYRIKMEDVSGVGLPVIPGYGQIQKLEQILPIEDEQVRVHTYVDGSRKNEPAEVFGIHYEGKPGSVADTKAGTEYKGGFQVIKEYGVILFADYVCRFVEAGQDAGGNKKWEVYPAKMRLRVAVSVRDQTKRCWVRYTRERQLGPPNFSTKARIIKREEIVQTFIPTYQRVSDSDEIYNLTKTESNEADVRKEADYYLDAAVQEYQTTTPRDVQYAGLKHVMPDGAIQQITWSVGGGGATTRISRDNEHSLYVMPYKERRRQEDLRNGVKNREHKKIIDAIRDLPRLIKPF